jgi:hypothetical protein
MGVRTKLECLSIASLSSLAQCLQVRLEPTQVPISGDSLHSWYPQTLGKCQRQTFQLATNISKLRSFYSIGPRGQFYKTFYGRKLRILVGKPFQPSSLFVGKARSLP